jgi:hypothetical protein
LSHLKQQEDRDGDATNVEAKDAGATRTGALSRS